jgi:putative DNA primase/helicase
MLPNPRTFKAKTIWLSGEFMAGISVFSQDDLNTIKTDFINNINQGNISEVAFANRGTSRFNSAIYYENISELDLLDFARAKSNVSFATGFGKKAIGGQTLGVKGPRRGTDKDIISKNIISFDLDFKQNVEGYDGRQGQLLAHEFSDRLKRSLDFHQIPLWMMVFTGNGIHLHFRLESPYQIESTPSYKRIYDAMRSYLECLCDLNFDPSCSNPSRLMRLPFSTNWKDSNNPIPCAVLSHNPDADFSPIFNGFRQLLALKPNIEGLSVRDKKEILDNLDFIKILVHFQYPKIDTLKETGEHLICSSPFNTDSNPSFFYHREKRLFYDFSAGFGGDLLELISRLGQIDIKKDFAQVLEIAREIAGAPVPEQREGCFEINERGLWYRSIKDTDPHWLSSPIYVEALTRDAESQSWGRLLTFKDQDGIAKSWSMPMELLAGDGSEIRRNLLGMGAELAVGKRERNLFLSYLQDSRPARRAYCVNRIGWHQHRFILPNKVYSASGHDVPIFLQAQAAASSFGLSGNLEDWQINVGDFCVGNSRLVLAVCSALASVLLKWTGEDSGGFNLVGPSSIGKSITLKIAASVWGNPGLNGFIKRWRSTLNGLELLAASRCDSLLILDELGEMPPKEAAIASYMLCGGISKCRSTKNLALAGLSEWRLIFLSSGELTLAAHVAQSGTQVNVGQEVRMLDIPAESLGSQGIFENTHGFLSPGLFASMLSKGSEKYFGTAIDDFLSKVVEMPHLLETLSERRKQFVDRVSNHHQHGQIQRALNRFSLLAAAGELGIELGTLSWQPGEANTQVQKCFTDWSGAWAAGGSREKHQLIQQVKSLLQEFGPSRFPILHDFKEQPEVHHQQLWGFRKKAEGERYEWIIMSEIFKNIFCKGHEYRRALTDLKDENLLLLGPVGQSSIPMRVPHLGVTRVVRLSPYILA